GPAGVSGSAGVSGPAGGSDRNGAPDSVGVLGPAGVAVLGGPGADPLRELADGCRDALAEVARLEARAAALKVRLAAAFVEATRAMACPAASAGERHAAQMGMVAGVGCVLA